MLCCQVLSQLGSVEEKDVVELGAGIGRFSGELAKTAASLLAVDFMQVSIDENRRLNSNHGNISFQVSPQPGTNTF